MTAARLGVVAFLGGAAVMVVELMAVRLLAPWFGQSQIVWTHVIGVVLASLAVGQWLGGRWAEGARGPGPALLLLLAGVWSLALPELVRALGAAVVPDELPLLEAYPFVTWGSLLVAVTTLSLPLLALGAVTPWLVRLSEGASEAPGRVTGRILGAGTAGSLAGTFGATHGLLPWLGADGAVLVAGGVVVVLSVAVGRGHRRVPPASLALLLLPLAAEQLPGAEPLDGRLLARRETPYQLARVVEQPDGTRLLRLNEGLDSFHSLHRPGHFWSGTYFDAFLLPALWAPPADDGRTDVLVLGLAAGTMARQLLEVRPDARVRGVEIDPEVAALGREFFDLPAAVDVVEGADARVAVAADGRRYGAILVDAYAQQIYLPPHLCTREFFEGLRARLLPGGVAALNVGGTSREDPVVNAVAGTFAEVFPGAVLGRVPNTRNMLVLGFAGETPGPAELSARVGAVSLPPLPADGSAVGLDWAWTRDLLAPVDAPVDGALHDGWAPVEALAHDAWRGRRVAVPPRSDEPAASATAPDDALAAARRALAHTDWGAAERALAPLLTAADPGVAATASLLTGNIAFERADFPAAVAAYDDALALTEDRPEFEGVASSARANRDAARSLGDTQQAFRASGSHLRTLTLTLITLLAAAITLLRRTN